jgi:hypothetical protein
MLVGLALVSGSVMILKRVKPIPSSIASTETFAAEMMAMLRPCHLSVAQKSQWLSASLERSISTQPPMS